MPLLRSNSAQESRQTYYVVPTVGSPVRGIMTGNFNGAPLPTDAMKKFTRLERDALERMLKAHLQDHNFVANVLTSLAIRSRTFSEDGLNKAMCCGFYLDFENSDLPVEFRNLPLRLAIQARHPGLPFGADFILFLNQQNQVFLEATFYGYSIAIDEVVSDEHGFSFHKEGLGAS